jgi:hypothetical protein
MGEDSGPRCATAWLSMAFALCWIGGCGTGGANGGDDGGTPPPDAQHVSECTDDQECTAPEAPFCSEDAICVGCSDDAQCAAADPAAGLCAADGACVGCRGTPDCTDPLAPVCDPDARSCRGCSADAECESGVCDLSEGRCFAAEDMYYVDDGAEAGSGDGSSGAPFASIGEAMAKFYLEPRNFIVVRDGQYTFPALDHAPLPAFIGTAAAQVIPATAGADCVKLDTSSRFVLRGFRFTGCATAVRIGTVATQVSVERTHIEDSTVGVDCRAKICIVNDSVIEDTTTGVRCTGDPNNTRCSLERDSVTGGDTGVQIANATLILHKSEVTGSRLIGLDLSKSEVEVQDVTVRGVGVGGTGATTGVTCVGGYCTFERTRVVGSRGAGLVAANSNFEIYSSSFLGNGSDDATLATNGGVVLLTPSTTKIFQNNTVAGNRAAGNAVAGVRCGAPITLKSSIVWSNTGTAIDATCSAEYSDIETPSEVLAGTGNIRVDPRLTSVTPGAMDEHLDEGSPCVDAGDPAGGPALDIDNQARPSGVRVDMGADERME